MWRRVPSINWWSSCLGTRLVRESTPRVHPWSPTCSHHIFRYWICWWQWLEIWRRISDRGWRVKQEEYDYKIVDRIGKFASLVLQIWYLNFWYHSICELHIQYVVENCKFHLKKPKIMVNCLFGMKIANCLLNKVLNEKLQINRVKSRKSNTHDTKITIFFKSNMCSGQHMHIHKEEKKPCWRCNRVIP